MDVKIFLQNLYKFYSELYSGLVKPAKPLIRLGAVNDGGYLLPDDLSGLKYCLSPGVADTADFEMDCATKYGMDVYMCDHTIDASPLEHPLFHFEKMGIGYGINVNAMMQPMSAWAKKCSIPQDSELIVQMDIEGAEYDFFLLENPEFFSRCRYIIMEMHYLHQMLQPMYFESRLLPFINAINKYFDIIHIHPNNHTVFVQFGGLNITSCLELTLGRRDLNKKTSPLMSYNLYPRHPLDAPNMPDKPEVELPDLKILREFINSIP